MRTRPAGARPIAARRPAMPPPPRRKSVDCIRMLSYQSVSMTLVRMLKIDVPTPSRAYTITIADGALDHVGRILDELGAPQRRFIVSSPLVWRLHGAQLARAVPAA